MKTCSVIFLFSLFFFAACHRPTFSQAVRSTASMDIDQQDHALIQTKTNNKVKALVYARQAAPTAPTAPKTTTTATVAPTTTTATVAPKTTTTATVAPTTTSATVKPAVVATPAPTAGNTKTVKRTTGSSFITLSMTVGAFLFALF